jgi:hypothetical protein
MSPIRIWIAAAGSLALLATLLPGVTRAETEDVVAVSAMSQDVRVAYGKTGQAIMDRIAAAQKAMATSSDYATAARETEHALLLLDSLSPRESYRAALGNLLHRHKAKKAKGDDVVPVMGVLDDVKEVSGVGVADTHTKLEKIKGKLVAEPSVDAEADIVSASEGVGYLEIDLPVQETKARLIAARIAESKRDAANANAALSDAMNKTKDWTALVQASATEAEAD